MRDSSRHTTNGKHHFYICQSGSLKFRRINVENSDRIGVFTGYIYFVALLWCSECINIRTQARFFKLGEIDCFSAVFVIECERNPVIIMENRIDKAVNQTATVVKLLGIKLSEPMKPKNNLFTGKRGLCHFFFDNLNGKFAFLLFKAFKPFFCRGKIPC